MKVHDNIDQQSAEWFNLRKNKVTGSKLPKLISCKSFEKLSGKVYDQEIGSIAIGEWVRDDGGGIGTQAMEEGHIGEGEANRLYNKIRTEEWEERHELKEKVLDVEYGEDRSNLARPYIEKEKIIITNHAFLESDCGRYGYSPDGVVSDGGFIEIKTIFNQGKFLQAMISEAQNLLIDDKYLMQIMMGFVISPKFKYCDFIVYSMYMPSECNLKIFRINRSDYEEKINQVKEILESEILPEIELVRQNFKKQFNLI